MGAKTMGSSNVYSRLAGLPQRGPGPARRGRPKSLLETRDFPGSCRGACPFTASPLLVARGGCKPSASPFRFWRA